MQTINISCVPYLLPEKKGSLPDILLRQFSANKPIWKDWKFVFNNYEGDYKYLVVCDNLPAPIKPKCPPENIIFLSQEPPAIIQYADRFLAQFGTVITQDIRIRHPRPVFYQPAIGWFVGSYMENDNQPAMSFAELQQISNIEKTKLMSVISSIKSNKKEHQKRLLFATKLKRHFGNQIDLYGRGIAHIADKLQALQDYKYHVVLENSSVSHYFTEKISDCFIAGSYPIYYGCPNLHDYFPKNSFAAIDIENFTEAIKTINYVINHNYYEKYQLQLQQAKQLVMFEHNLFPMLIKLINNLEQGVHGTNNNIARYGEHIFPYNYDDSIQLSIKNKKSFWSKIDIVAILKKHYLRYSCKKLARKQNI